MDPHSREHTKVWAHIYACRGTMRCFLGMNKTEEMRTAATNPTQPYAWRRMGTRFRTSGIVRSFIGMQQTGGTATKGDVGI
eukprot:scaffold278948_cov28-Tisochrysis_lutea.AAC.1